MTWEHMLAGGRSTADLPPAFHRGPSPEGRGTKTRARELCQCLLSAFKQALRLNLSMFHNLSARRTYAKDLAGAFDKRPDLRVVICQALARLASQSRRVANAAGGQQVGFADPSAAAAAAVPEEAGGEGGEDDEDQLPEGFTAEMAAK